MTWTTEILTEPGWYWMRNRHLRVKYCVQVEHGNGWNKYHHGDHVYMNVNDPALEWAGPIPSPDDAQTPQPNELEKLKVEVPDLKFLKVEWTEGATWMILVTSTGPWVKKLSGYEGLQFQAYGRSLDEAITEIRKKIAEFQSKKE